MPSSQGLILASTGTGRTLWSYKPDTPFSGIVASALVKDCFRRTPRLERVAIRRKREGRVAVSTARIRRKHEQRSPYGNGVVVGVVSLGDKLSAWTRDRARRKDR